MSPAVRLLPVWVGMVLAAVAPAAAADPPPPGVEVGVERGSDPAALRKEALAAARNGTVTRRLEILGQLAARAEDDRLDLVIRVGCSSKDAAVREAARTLLAGLCAEDGVEAALCARATRELRTGKEEIAAEILAALVVAEPQADPWPVASWIDEAGPAGVQLCWSVATAAAGRGQAADVAILGGLTRLPLHERDHAFRRGVVRALIAVNSAEALAALAALLADLRGEARADVIAYLAFVSGRNYGTDAAAWAAWVAENREGFVPPPPQAEYPPPARPLESADNHDDPAYYGIPLYAERLVFVVDVSSSMAERGRLEKAKRELESAVRVLPPTAAFTIIAYSDEAVAWEKRLVPADDDAKNRALAFVRALRPDGRTATGDALALAFSFDVEAVYLLSDGEPTAGKVVLPARIVRMVADANRTRRVSVHAIGVAPAPKLADFLALLARSNYGRFHRVDD